MRLTKWLIIRADGEARVVGRTPRLRMDEFAYRLVITVPESWASIIGDIDLTLPDPSDAPNVEVTRS